MYMELFEYRCICHEIREKHTLHAKKHNIGESDGDTWTLQGSMGPQTAQTDSFRSNSTWTNGQAHRPATPRKHTSSGEDQGSGEPGVRPNPCCLLQCWASTWRPFTLSSRRLWRCLGIFPSEPTLNTYKRRGGALIQDTHSKEQITSPSFTFFSHSGVRIRIELL